MSTSTDGLHIATALGDGEAQVADFKQTEAAARGVFDNFKKQKEEKKKAETDLKKNFNDSLKEIKRDAIRQDYQELYEKENDIVKRFNEHVYKSNNKIDPVFVNDLKAELREVAGLHQYSAKFKHDFEKVEGILATDKDDRIDPEFKKEWLEYASLPLAKRVEYEKEKGFPQVRYREPNFDEIAFTSKLLITSKKGEDKDKGSFISSSTENDIDVEKTLANSEKAVDAFFSGINLELKPVIKSIEKELEGDVNYRNSTTEEKIELVKAKAVERLYKGAADQFEKDKQERLKNKPQPGGGSGNKKQPEKPQIIYDAKLFANEKVGTDKDKKGIVETRTLIAKRSIPVTKGSSSESQKERIDVTEMIDIKTGVKIDEAELTGDQKTNITNIIELPVSKKSGTISYVTDKKAYELAKSGKNPDVEWKWFAQGTATFNVAAADEYSKAGTEEKAILIPYEGNARATLEKQYGFKLDDVLNESGGQQQPQSKPAQQPSKPQKPKMTDAEWSTAWGKLKKGESMVGLDGKVYIKK
jgi:hypothetical protein